MAKIPLRAYLRDIDNLINRNEIAPAIAHAKNILRTYPKHIDTYRTLGQAFLEGKRYGEAADIFQRVLSVLPDDFVAHVGLSIIREDERNLDSAIWHMERAYEVQPFNPAVQEELRRLYGKRDGAVPPKIRLTRGALVRMYMRGELYPQAVAEARAALAEDPQRYDLMVLLAQLYNLADQKLEATEVCSALINKLPYCYEANLILSQILPGTSRAKDATRFQQRVYALDPYAAFTGPNAETPEQVPDQAVMVEPYTWDPSAPQAPDWAQTVGMEWEASEEEALPDWISGIEQESMPPSQQAGAVEFAQETGTEEIFPDWMKEAGWTPAEQASSETPPPQYEAFSEEPQEEAAPAEIPDWLQSIAPAAALEEKHEEEERTDWLEDILEQPAAETPSAGTPLETGDLPDWFAGVTQEESPPTAQPAASIAGESYETTELPDWFAQAAQNETTAEQSDREPESEEVPSAAESASLNELWLSSESGEETAAEPLPDWLSSLQEESTQTGQADALPDWMQGIEQTPAETAVPTTATETPAVSTETDLPFEAQVTADAEQVNEGMPDLNDMDAAMAWLEALAARQGADEATLTSNPEERSEVMPDWLQQQVAEAPADEQTPVSAEEIIPTEPVIVEQVPASEGPSVEPEPLMPPHGSASEEPALTEPDSAEEAQLPDWLLEMQEDQQEGAETPAAETTQAEPPVPDWMLDSVAEYPSETEETIVPGDIVAEQQTQRTGMPEPAAESGLPADEQSGETEAFDQTGMPDLDDLEAAMAWLEGLAAKQGADEATLTTRPEDRTEAPPEWVKQEMDAGKMLDASPATFTEEMQKAEESVPPQWLQEAQMETVDEAADEVAEEVIAPQWLQEVQMETIGEDTNSAAEEVLTPQWLEEAQMETAESSAAQADQTPPNAGETAGAELTAQQIEAMSEDELFAWLETLAARQGAESSMVQAESVEQPQEVPLPTSETPAEPVTVEETAESAPAGEQQEWQLEAETPDWLSSIEKEETGPLPSMPWQTTGEEAPTAEEVAAEPEVEPSSLPDWLQEVAETAGSESTETGEAIPEWLRGMTGEQEEALPPEPEPAVAPEALTSIWETEEPEAETVEETSEQQPAPVSLLEARAVLNRGDLNYALEGYDRLIQQGENLPDVIHDLRDALYRYPVDILLWQTLGDAYARNDQLQEAIDAYTKAEELLR